MKVKMKMLKEGHNVLLFSVSILFIEKKEFYYFLKGSGVSSIGIGVSRTL